MSEIKVNQLTLNEQITQFKDKGSNLDTGISSVSKSSKCSGIMLKEYEKRIIVLRDLLNKYKQLIEKDSTDISTAVQQYEEMDKSIENNVVKWALIII